MNPDHEEFSALRKLLAWKRHEQPPPGYFRDFAPRVMDLIEMGEARKPACWWRELLSRYDLGPAMATALGLVVMVTYLLGLSLSDLNGVGAAQAGSATPAAWQNAGLQGAASAILSAGGTVAPRSTLESGLSEFPPSMNPVVSAEPPPGLFSPGAGMRPQQIQRAGHSRGTNR
jgi:hypothetical protein